MSRLKIMHSRAKSGRPRIGRRQVACLSRSLIPFVVAWACASAPAFAQTSTEYLRMRAHHKISQSVGQATLETLVGTRIVEIKGVVKGTFRMGERASIMLEKADGSTEIVEASAVPDWLTGNEVPARLLIEATRPAETAPLRARLLGAAPEHVVAQHEADSLRAARQAEEKRKQDEERRRATSSSSRSSTPVTVRNDDWRMPVQDVIPVYANFIKSQNRRLTDEMAIRIAREIVYFSVQYGVDARLIMAMVMVESGFNPGATSRAGAMGLGQLMPGTAAGMGISNAYDTTENLFGTVRLVRNHLDKYQRQAGHDFDGLILALAAYNAGSGAVRRHGGVPPYRETQNYVRKVIDLYRRLSGG
jgi:soluble lytic murein transglycosylase-like protein